MYARLGPGSSVSFSADIEVSDFPTLSKGRICESHIPQTPSKT